MRIKSKISKRGINNAQLPVTTGYVVGDPVTDECSGSLPEFGRWRDVERIFGVKRGVLYRKIADGTVTSISLREPGKKFGVRLIFLPSVRAWLLREMTNQNAPTGSAFSTGRDLV